MKRRLAALAATATILTSMSAGATPPPKLEIVHFGSNDGDTDLFKTASADEFEIVVEDPGHDCGPSISADGRLAFGSARQHGDGYRPLVFDLYLQESRDAEPVRLTNSTSGAGFPSWSPDGEWIAFWQDAGIWKMRPGDPSEQILLASHDRGTTGAPAWSPDGSSIAYTVGPPTAGEIWIMDADGSNQRRLVTHASEPAWHPSSTSLAFTDLAGHLPAFSDIGQIDFDPVAKTVDPTSRRIIVGGPDAEYSPSFSPDGDDLTFVRDPDGITSVFPVWLPGDIEVEVHLGGPQPGQVWVLGEAEPRTNDPVGVGFPTFVPFEGWWAS